MEITAYEGKPTIQPGATLAFTVDKKIEGELVELETGERLWANSDEYYRTDKGFLYAFTNCANEIPAGHLLVGVKITEIE